MKLGILGFLFILIYAPSLKAQSGGKAEQIVDAAIAALGGDHFLQMQNRIASGRIYAFFHDSLSGYDQARIYVKYLAPSPGNKLAQEEREQMGKKGDYGYLFLPNQAWEITYRGARQIPDNRWDDYVRNTQNDILYFLRERRNEPGLTFDYIGRDALLSTEVDIVEITDSHDQTIRVYFDRNTHFPVRETYSWFDPVLKEHNDEVINYDNFRDAGSGVKWPFSTEREHNGYKSYQMFADSVEVDQPVPPGTFELPPGVKLLKKVE
jgi:hypothetical protein